MSHLGHLSLTELKSTDTQANHIFANLSDLETKVFFKSLEKPNHFALKKENNLLFSKRLLMDLNYLCDPADLAFVCWTVASSRQGALFNWTSAVQWNIGGGAQVKWIVGVVIELVGICQVLLTGSQNLPGLKWLKKKKMIWCDAEGWAIRPPAVQYLCQLTCCATLGLGPSSSRRRANPEAILKLRSLKNRFRAVRKTSTMCTGCRLQWVK